MFPAAAKTLSSKIFGTLGKTTCSKGNAMGFLRSQKISDYIYSLELQCSTESGEAQSKSSDFI